uniref:Uncharacterized protein n=1 Tax=Lepeophtheirus salmonis TaxID=72036 RepID=A0A0K2UDA8_LEPSM
MEFIPSIYRICSTSIVSNELFDQNDVTFILILLSFIIIMFNPINPSIFEGGVRESTGCGSEERSN